MNDDDERKCVKVHYYFVRMILKTYESMDMNEEERIEALKERLNEIITYADDNDIDLNDREDQ